MHICGAPPYDQHLMLGDRELKDSNQNIGTLGVYPGATLKLKVKKIRVIFIYTYVI